MSLLYAKDRVYQVKFTKDGEQITIKVDGNIGKFGCDEPLFEWEGSVTKFVDMLWSDIEKDLD